MKLSNPLNRAPRDPGPPGPETMVHSSAAGRPGVAPATEELARRREQLSRRFADLQWDLGGMAYEMASRDHFRLDVLTRQAAALQGVDAELGEIERVLRLDEAAAAGSCPSCGALFARGAAFCWSCGTTLIPAAEPASGAAPATEAGP